MAAPVMQSYECEDRRHVIWEDAIDEAEIAALQSVQSKRKTRAQLCNSVTWCYRTLLGINVDSLKPFLCIDTTHASTIFLITVEHYFISASLVTISH